MGFEVEWALELEIDGLAAARGFSDTIPLGLGGATGLALGVGLGGATGLGGAVGFPPTTGLMNGTDLDREAGASVNEGISGTASIGLDSDAEGTAMLTLSLLLFPGTILAGLTGGGGFLLCSVDAVEELLLLTSWAVFITTGDV